ncbi:hypothetical protein INR49_008132 [Caranx melampygus]|nr:hypothetical protein INR49_008132 [Caranx melampygus]
MSTASKVVLGLSVVLTVGTVAGVHLKQAWDRQSDVFGVNGEPADLAGFTARAGPGPLAAQTENGGGQTKRRVSHIAPPPGSDPRPGAVGEEEENLRRLEEQRILTRHLKEERQRREAELHPQAEDHQ